MCRVALRLPGLRGSDPVCVSPPDLGPLKLPVLAASKSLRRSRKAGAARMDAG
ncbi:LysR family transcriptional regulator [Klebsiella sp. H-Nf2]|nr:LysR family transcriptional regulator [Klebsiella sp. H-Nf2]